MSTILLTDDEPVILRSYRRVLERNGFQVETADCGEAALEVLARDGIDVLVTDVWMPGIGGIELLRRVRQLRPTLPVIIMTGRQDAEDARQAAQRSATYLLKPVLAQELIDILHRLIAGT
jgi:DNA-binding NtrC family response regulator